MKAGSLAKVCEAGMSKVGRVSVLRALAKTSGGAAARKVAAGPETAVRLRRAWVCLRLYSPACLLLYRHHVVASESATELLFLDSSPGR